MSAPPPPSAVLAAIAEYPDAARETLLEVRRLVYRVARDTGGVGELEESLKWGQPALRPLSGSGTTVRLALARGDDAAVGVYTSCQTPLVADFAREHGDLFRYDGGRGIHVPTDAPVPTDELGDFVEVALTYHARKRG